MSLFDTKDEATDALDVDENSQEMTVTECLDCSRFKDVTRKVKSQASPKIGREY